MSHFHRGLESNEKTGSPVQPPSKTLGSKDKTSEDKGVTSTALKSNQTGVKSREGSPVVKARKVVPSPTSKLKQSKENDKKVTSISEGKNVVMTTVKSNQTGETVKKVPKKEAKTTVVETRQSNSCLLHTTSRGETKNVATTPNVKCQPGNKSKGTAKKEAKTTVETKKATPSPSQKQTGNASSGSNNQGQTKSVPNLKG